MQVKQKMQDKIKSVAHAREETAVVKVMLSEFLLQVVAGEQEQAEDILKDNLYLGLLAGDVTDLSKRSFNNITGLQYAVWALDYHMWTMLLKYLKPEDITKQLKDMKTGSWVKDHGESVSWQNLIDALDTYIRLGNQSKCYEAAKQWNREVGDAQALLPVHVVNEYCHPTRSFDPCPNFKNVILIPRLRETEIGDWFTSKYKGCTIGSGVFAYMRDGSTRVGWRIEGQGGWNGRCGGIVYDHTACLTLLANRMEQQQDLFAEYLDNESQAHFKLK